jgi:large subunit ribosomal protein L18
MLVQLINDAEAKTLLSLSTDAGKTANVALSTELGKSVAKKAASVGISSVVFDRGGRVFHGRVAAVAAGAREGGLKF